MNINHLKYFIEVCETGSVTQSATNLNISQPALSRAIRSIEQELGVKLVEKAGRGIVLTPEGDSFARRAAKVCAEYELAASEVKQASKHAKSTVRVHIGSASLVALDIIGEWMEARPDTRFELVMHGAARDSRMVDVALAGFRMPDAVKSAKFSERIMLACSDQIAESLVPMQPLPLSALVDMGLITLDDTSGFRATCDAVCNASGFAPNIVLESDNPEVVRKAISMELGVGFWAERSWNNPGDGITLIEMEDDRFKRDVAISLLPHGIEKECARSFYDYLACRMQKLFTGSAASAA